MNEIMNTSESTQVTSMWQPIAAAHLDQEVLRQFLTECCRPDPRGSVRANRMYAEYRSWCYSRDELPVRIKLFSDEMHRAGVVQSMAEGRRYWRGIRLTKEADHDQ